MTTPIQETHPLLPLDTLRAFLQYNPYHFFGLSNSNIPLNSQCNTLVAEYGFQDALRVGRAEIRERILYAEQKLADYLRYDVAPRYRVDTLPWVTRFDHISRRWGVNSNGEYMSLTLPYGYTQAVGAETVTSIATSVAITTTLAYRMSDTFTLSVATTVTDPDEIAIYFNATDRAAASGVTDEPVSQRWRIQPVSVSIVAGVATIKGSTWLLVKPTHYQGFSAPGSGLDPATAGVLATSLDVARVWIDPDGETVTTAGATLIWETWPWPGYCVACSSASPNNPYSADPAATGQAVARCGIRDVEMGIVTPGSAVYSATATPPQWIATPFANCTEPDRVTVRYLGGLPLVNGRMNSFWAEIVCMLTVAEIPGPICACKETNQRLDRWQFDLARSSGNGGEQYAYISSDDLNGPFGTRRGQVEAWRRVKQLRNTPGVMV